MSEKKREKENAIGLLHLSLQMIPKLFYLTNSPVVIHFFLSSFLLSSSSSVPFFSPTEAAVVEGFLFD